ncbi:uncharacterized protein LOC135373434 [Ornithodoros turicata]|uniref:uncharacterized protein LOC135373434 n=1 Tax=Ornithodoros turicata TaxID=34597 RepID=UPI003138E301
MPTHCCVPLCKQRGTKDSDGNKVSFHRFPNDETLYKKWIIAIKRDEGKDFQVTKCTKVCSKHFRACDFIPGVASGHNLLRDTAVPSVFAFSKPCKVRKPPKQRAALPQQFARRQEQVSADQYSFDSPDLPEGIFMHTDEEAVCSVEQTGQDILDAQDTVCLMDAIKEKDTEISKLRHECDSLKEQLKAARAAVHELQAQNLSLECQLEEEKGRTSSFAIERFKDSNEDIMLYTGLPSYGHFEALQVYLHPGENGYNVLRSEDASTARSAAGRKRKLSPENELFLVLVRLRLGLLEADLAHRFSITQSTVSRICTSWINFLYVKLSALPLWPPREVINATMPPQFAEKYASTRVILDATEIRCEVPSSLSLQSSTYSSYKSSNTFKGLIGVSPNGLVTFVSELFTGSTSDRECVLRSGFLDLDFEQNDSVMADKGFVIADLLEKRAVKLNIPPFLNGGTFSTDEVMQTKEIASLRIHVERRIQRIKGYHIFDKPIPLTMAPLINQMWTVAAILTNFQSDLIQA